VRASLKAPWRERPTLVAHCREIIVTGCLPGKRVIVFTLRSAIGRRSLSAGLSNGLVRICPALRAYY